MCVLDSTDAFIIMSVCAVITCDIHYVSVRSDHI